MYNLLGQYNYQFFGTSGSGVTQFNGRTGNVTLISTDVTTALGFTPLSSPVGITDGGTGQITAGAAFNALSPITTTGDLIIGNGSDSATRLPIGTNGYVLTVSGGTAVWSAASTGTVTSVSVVSANGFAGTVANATTTPAITLTTSITGVIKGNGTALSAATTGTDYSAGTSALATGILKSTTSTGGLSIAVAADFPTLNQNTTGNAATATLATDSSNTLVTTTTTNANYPFALVPTSSTGQQSLLMDTDVTYNPSTDVLTLPSTGYVSAGAIQAATYLSIGVSTIASAGVNQGGATATTTSQVNVNSGVLNSGVILPSSTLGSIVGNTIWITNDTGNTIYVYPNSGGTIDSGATNTPFTLSGGQTVACTLFSSNTWFTTSNVFYGGTGIALSHGIGGITITLNTPVSLANGGTGYGATSVSDLFNHISPITSTGDLIIGNGSNSTTRLGIGSNGYVLTSTGTTAQWSQLPATVSSIAGTANEITASASTGAVTLSVPNTFVAPGTLSFTSYFIRAVTSIAGAGSTQATATAITSSEVNISSGAALSGVILPSSPSIGTDIDVTNNSINNIYVYPQSGGTIDGAAANSPATLGPGQTAKYTVLTSGAWYTTVNAIFSGGGVNISHITGGVSISLQTPVTIANGGTGHTTAGAAFNALSPMTTTGDIEYESATNTASRLAIGTTGQVLTVVSGKPAWVSPTGNLWIWGDNSYGAIGNGQFIGGGGGGGQIVYSVPIPVGTSNLWSNVVAGDGSILGVQTNGANKTLWAWGNNTQGEQGNLSNFQYMIPTQIGTGTSWTNTISNSQETMGAVDSSGNLWTWGGNSYGQLGQGDTNNRSSPTQVGALTTWSKIANGLHFLAVQTDGTLWVWGLNNHGQLGNSDATLSNISSPIQVGLLTNWANVSAGFTHSIAVQTDGTLWAWGDNSQGQLGNNDATLGTQSSPVQIGSLTTWAQASAGGYYSMAIETDGTLWGWGGNRNGNIGDGTTTPYSSPVQIGSLTTWSQVSINKSSFGPTFAIKTDGTLWGWGGNQLVGLGLGQQGQSVSSPTQVGDLTTWTTVSFDQSNGVGIHT